MLKNGVFRRLWCTQTLSSVGDEIRNWAILFWVFAEADQAVFYRTALLFAQMLPVFIMAPLAGTWVDRRKPKKVLQATLVIRAAMSFVLAGLIWMEQVPLLLVMLAFTCTVQQFFQPAISKLTVTAVDNEDYGTASSSVKTVDTLISLAGPAIGAFVYEWWGASTSLIVDGFCFIVGSLFILGLKVRPAPLEVPSGSGPATSFWVDVLEGFRYIFASALTKRLFIMLAVMGACTGAINLLNIYFVVKELHLDQNYLAWASTAGGIGMFAGALGLNLLGAKFKNYVRINIWGAAVMTLGLLLLTLSFGSWSMLLSRAIIGIGISLLSITLSTLLMTYVPENLLGRVGSVFEGGPLATNMLSYLFFGWLYVYTGARLIFGISTMLFFMAFLLALSLRSVLSPARRVRAEQQEFISPSQ
ncbi:MFS transporter [Paenibacillus sp. FSL R7-0302]|uniref:MFS transporter n=1 Tax=Paenibacillus sp. FSL R7-0302 TaxID=2921681 RepID=UPI0030F83564